MGLDSVELVMDVEETFDIEISDREASNIETVGQFYDFILAKLAAAQRNMDKQEVWETLRKCIVKIGGMAPEKVVPEARIIKDLGIH